MVRTPMASFIVSLSPVQCSPLVMYNISTKPEVNYLAVMMRFQTNVQPMSAMNRPG